MFLLIATRSVQPTLKSAREFCKEAQPPRIIGHFIEARNAVRYLHSEIVLGRLNGAGIVGVEDIELPRSTRLPLHITADWTYWLASTTDGHNGS